MPDFMTAYVAFGSAVLGGFVVAGAFEYRKRAVARTLRRMISDAQSLADDGLIGVDEAKRKAEEAALRDAMKSAVAKL